jgi:hypothetical protein
MYLFSCSINEIRNSVSVFVELLLRSIKQEKINENKTITEEVQNKIKQTNSEQPKTRTKQTANK